MLLVYLVEVSNDGSRRRSFKRHLAVLLILLLRLGVLPSGTAFDPDHETVLYVSSAAFPVHVDLGTVFEDSLGLCLHKVIWLTSLLVDRCPLWRRNNNPLGSLSTWILILSRSCSCFRDRCLPMWEHISRRVYFM